MHKLDQDRLIFDEISRLALTQGIMDHSRKLIASVTGLTYYFMGIHVCRSTFASLFGAAWHPRLTRIRSAVLSGSLSCPLDLRFGDCAKKHIGGVLRGEVWSYVRSLYDSCAETLPEDDDNSEEIYCEPCVVDDNCECDDVSLVSKFHADDPTGSKELRRMPPGSIYELWRQYKGLGNQGSYRLFWSVWSQDFPFLKFRSVRQHSSCAVCTKHRLLIRSFSNDIVSRTKQRHLYDMHLKNQYRDRETYWNVRAQSRLYQKAIHHLFLGQILNTNMFQRFLMVSLA